MIEIKHIYKSYQDFEVLKDINLAIKEGKITALIGSNGAGKSTLLSVVSRLTTQNQGEIWIDGENMFKMSSEAIAKKLAILKQTNHISMRVTVRELITFGRFPHSKGRLKDEDIKMIEMAIDYMKLRDIEHKSIDKLSGGQRQRAYIAMVMAQDTPYILLDEPLNNLDMKHAVEMMSMLEKMVKELGKTIVVVMHDINFAAAFADHIIAMKDGEILAEGNTNDMVEKDILDRTFDHDFCIAGYNGRKVCLYYQNQTGNDRVVSLDKGE